jgi:hypothetical protein
MHFPIYGTCEESLNNRGFGLQGLFGIGSFEFMTFVDIVTELTPFCFVGWPFFEGKAAL